MKLPDYTSMGRDKLIEEHKAMLENLTSTQNRCTELVNENRELNQEIIDVSKVLELTDRQKEGFYKVLLRLASSTSARWDQHLRYEIGDEDADIVIKFLKATLLPEV